MDALLLSRCVSDRVGARNSRLLNLLALLFSLSYAAATAATELTQPKLHGYVSQGLTLTSDNRFFGDSEELSWEFTDVAVGFTWRPYTKLQIAGQALYRRAGDTSRDDVYTDYALMDLTLMQELSGQAGFRAGRIKNPYGFYNDTRDVAANRPSVLLAESIYRDPIRDVYHTSDSVSFYGNYYLGEHLFQLDLLKGTPQMTDLVENEFLIPIGMQGDLVDEEIELGRVLLESYGGLLRFAYTQVRVQSDLEPDPGTRQVEVEPGVFVTIPLHGYPGRTVTRVKLWSAELNYEDWQLTSEFQNLTFHRRDSSPRGRVNQPTRSFYISAAYRISGSWQVFIRRDIYYAHKDDKHGREFESATAIPSYTQYAYDTTLGLRYNAGKRWHIGVEAHRIKGTAWLSHNENNLAQSEKNWSLFVAKVSYQF
ncbi:hypothetical protein HBA55_06990 [Pseudomaricurvus alkylphenolicus]|jgi:hypothetical protein|uniref:hypothetical protein n=1 Tax=Pseudomaricurvus alkylphenolicus TaxID=1306991 RepID=UPI00141E0C62|nr:hypothetical protein [Pseudomaricurvus alkylphenolicus]NIB39323.1 hypothetical protein [Pseudomaricurvus alkylphenolicus]